MATPVSVEALAQYLIDNSLLLSALELFQELAERGEPVPSVLHSFFARDEFLARLAKIEKSAAKRQAKLSSPGLVIANEQDYQRRIKNLEYDLRQERNNAQLLRKELECAYMSEKRAHELQALEHAEAKKNDSTTTATTTATATNEARLGGSAFALTSFEELSLYFHVHAFLKERGLVETETVFQNEIGTVIALDNWSKEVDYIYGLKHASFPSLGSIYRYFLRGGVNKSDYSFKEFYDREKERNEVFQQELKNQKETEGELNDTIRQLNEKIALLEVNNRQLTEVVSQKDDQIAELNTKLSNADNAYKQLQSDLEVQAVELTRQNLIREAENEKADLSEKLQRASAEPESVPLDSIHAFAARKRDFTSILSTAKATNPAGTVSLKSSAEIERSDYGSATAGQEGGVELLPYIPISDQLKLLSHVDHTSPEGIVAVLTRSLPNLLKYASLKRKEEFLPSLVLCIACTASERHCRALIQTFFALFPSPDPQQRLLVTESMGWLAKALGPKRLSSDVLPYCWGNLVTCNVDQKLLAADYCGVLARYVEPDLTLSFLFSVLNQLHEDSSEAVRLSVVNNISLLLLSAPLCHSSEKFFQVEQLLLEIMQDASEAVSELSSRLFLPIFNAWCERSERMTLFTSDLFGRLEKIASKTPTYQQFQSSDTTLVVLLFKILQYSLPQLFEYSASQLLSSSDQFSLIPKIRSILQLVRKEKEKFLLNNPTPALHESAEDFNNTRARKLSSALLPEITSDNATNSTNNLSSSQKAIDPSSNQQQASQQQALSPTELFISQHLQNSLSSHFQDSSSSRSDDDYALEDIRSDGDDSSSDSTDLDGSASAKKRREKTKASSTASTPQSPGKSTFLSRSNNSHGGLSHSPHALPGRVAAKRRDKSDASNAFASYFAGREIKPPHCRLSCTDNYSSSNLNSSNPTTTQAPLPYSLFTLQERDSVGAFFELILQLYACGYFRAEELETPEKLRAKIERDFVAMNSVEEALEAKESGEGENTCESNESTQQSENAPTNPFDEPVSQSKSNEKPVQLSPSNYSTNPFAAGSNLDASLIDGGNLTPESLQLLRENRFTFPPPSDIQPNNNALSSSAKGNNATASDLTLSPHSSSAIAWVAHGLTPRLIAFAKTVNPLLNLPLYQSFAALLAAAVNSLGAGFLSHVLIPSFDRKLKKLNNRVEYYSSLKRAQTGGLSSDVITNNLSHVAYLNQRNWLTTLFLGGVAPHVGVDYLKTLLNQLIQNIAFSEHHWDRKTHHGLIGVIFAILVSTWEGSYFVEFALSYLWELVVHAKASVRTFSSVLFIEMSRSLLDEKMIATRVLPALITLSSDTQLAVRFAAINAFGDLSVLTLNNDMLDKISLSLETMMSLGDLRITREITRMFGRIATTVSATFRDEFVIPQLVKFAGELEAVDDKNDRKKNVIALYSAFAILHSFSLEADMKSFIIPALENLLEFSDYLQENQASTLEDMLQDFQEACGITPAKKEMEIKYPIEFQEIAVDEADFQPRTPRVEKDDAEKPAATFDSFFAEIKAEIKNKLDEKEKEKEREKEAEKEESKSEEEGKAAQALSKFSKELSTRWNLWKQENDK